VSFWKCPARKIYAIPKVGGDRKKPARNHGDSDDESFKANKKVKRSISELEKDVSAIANDLHELKESMASLITVNSAIQLPLSLAKLVQDGFKCKICLVTPMKPPVVASRCCNTLLGCSSCVNKWYEGDGGLDRGCPNCREARGYAHSVQFKGLDEFLQGFSSVMNTNEPVE